MTFPSRHFRTGVGLTVLLALSGLLLADLPVLSRLGPLSVALLLGLSWRSLMHISEDYHVGIGFSAKQLLRIGIVLLGVRLDFALIAQSGWKILVLDLAVIGFGLAFIPWLGKRAGLEGRLALLVAVGTSICGASAVAATAPVIGACESEIALAIPLVSVLGTLAALGLTLAQGILHLAPKTYGALAGSTLHEVAQVVAAAAAVPGALESGTVAKLLRVLLLAPIVFLLGWFYPRKAVAEGPIQKPWFVGGFLLMGVVRSGLLGAFPSLRPFWTPIEEQILTIANFLMAMAMAGLGLQVDMSLLRRQGFSATKLAVGGWLGLFVLAAILLFLLDL